MKTSKKLGWAAIATIPWLVLFATAKPGTSDEADQIARGKYLVAYGGCIHCHTPFKRSEKGFEPDMARFLSGHPQNAHLPPPHVTPGPWSVETAGNTAWAGPWGITYSANLTPDTNTGMGIWTEDMFVQAMRTGKHMGAGRNILPPMPWQSLAALHDDDLKAIYVYLRTIPPIRNEVPAPISLGGNVGPE
ncbi:MAG TPA: diheme cytochrome c-553 [Verrucomicrobiae bacterium]|jgi:hypothetical protein|nr:diheme cytochrome c-553 [Verrucomicrobiae bacterium]